MFTRDNACVNVVQRMRDVYKRYSMCVSTIENEGCLHPFHSVTRFARIGYISE